MASASRTGIDATIISANLTDAAFDADLASFADASPLGYQAGFDLVFRLDGGRNLGSAASDWFI